MSLSTPIRPFFYGYEWQGVFDHAIHEKLDQMARSLARIEQLLRLEGKFIMSTLDDLATQVQANADAEAAAVQLIQGLADQLAAVAGDPAKVAALSAQLKASADALGAAILANTPAAPPAPAPAPTPDPAPAP